MRGSRTSSNREFGMVEDEGVHEVRRSDVANARRVGVDEKEGRLVGVTIDVRVHDDVIAGVVGSYEPLLAVDHVAVAIGDGLGLYAAWIGSRFGLGDRETAPPLSLGSSAAGTAPSAPRLPKRSEIAGCHMAAQSPQVARPSCSLINICSKIE